jgi:hypothetical protein
MATASTFIVPLNRSGRQHNPVLTPNPILNWIRIADLMLLAKIRPGMNGKFCPGKRTPLAVG